jgi:hypothetical protein
MKEEIKGQAKRAMGKEESLTGETGVLKKDAVSFSKTALSRTGADQNDIWSILRRYDSYITLANQKASYLMAGSGVLLMASITERAKILAATEMGCVKWLNEALYLIATVGLFALFICGLLVILPITKSGNGKDRTEKYTSLIAYQSVALMDRKSFLSKLSLAGYDLWNDLAVQTHLVARITLAKFRILGIAAWIALITVICMSVLFFFAVFK